MVQNHFFDLHKLANVVSDSSDETVTAACCSAFADATCADWNTMTCNDMTANYKVDTNSAPADMTEVNGVMTGLSDSTFQGTCCSERATCGSYTCSAGSLKSGAASTRCLSNADSCTDAVCCDAPQTCADYMGVWVAAQLVNGGCMVQNHFFDLHKLANVVSDSSDETVTAACCSAFADATCADWNLMTCDDMTANYKVNTNSAPADMTEVNGVMTGLSDSTFQGTCCSERATCGSYTCSGGSLKSNPNNIRCATDSASCTFTQCCNADANMACADYVQSVDAADRLAVSFVGFLLAMVNLS